MIATFITTKSGSKLTKKAAAALSLPEGTKVGCDKIRVTLSVVSFDDLLKGDLALLEGADRDQIRALVSITHSDADWEDAWVGEAWGRKGILTSLRQTAEGVNPHNLHLDAYTVHESGIGKVHNETGEYHISGLITSYEVIERDPNRAPPTESGVVVRLKDAIEKILDLKTSKWRQFRLTSADEVIFSN